uniref:gliding motility lipoprotein GldD n=1 Tax=Flavobacterium phycosphaerae TaxID=2697515 RepID=UPI0021D06966|nr:gliding motility lipoprotein GldD [Flavobacterium phycosphaerae]
MIIGGFSIAFLLTMIIGCKDDVLPKPASQLRLDYPVAKYASFSNHCPIEFEINEDAVIKEDKNCEFSIHYPKMKATIYLTYKTVNNDIDNLLRDAQNLTYKLHTLKADEIIELPFINKEKRVFGTFYDVTGNAATNSLFYATDSIKHFVTGSVYFYAKPNYDSILPAESYVKNDMQHLMETIKWK